MAKPPETPPSSDIDGVHEDEERNTDTAIAVGQDHKDLKRASDQDVARPEYSNQDSRDDRSS